MDDHITDAGSHQRSNGFDSLIPNSLISARSFATGARGCFPWEFLSGFIISMSVQCVVHAFFQFAKFGSDARVGWDVMKTHSEDADSTRPYKCLGVCVKDEQTGFAFGNFKAFNRINKNKVSSVHSSKLCRVPPRFYFSVSRCIYFAGKDFQL